MEYPTPMAGGLQTLAQFSPRERLELGCTDHCDLYVEAPEEIVTRAQKVLNYLDKGRMTLYPDYGFSPSVQNPWTWTRSYLKLKAMCAATGNP